jgi:hypothetical protein
LSVDAPGPEIMTTSGRKGDMVELSTG